MQVWNQQNPSAQLTANFTLAFLTATSNKGHGKLTGGAFFLALEHLNANQSDDNIRLHFDYVFKDTMNMDTMAMRAMVDTHCDKNNVSVFIGPPDFCSNAAVLATSFDIPYMSYDCNEMHSLTRNMSDYLIINEEPSGIYVSKFIVSVLQGFGWKSFWLVGGAEGVTNVWADTTNILNSLATSHGLTLNGINREPLNDAYHSSKTSSHNPYPDIINNSTRKTRVYVFLGDYNALVDFVRALHDRTGSARGEYVVVALDDTKQQRNNKTSFLRIDETNRNVTSNDLEVFRNVLLLRSLQPTTEQKDFAKLVYEYNYQDPINLTKGIISAVPKLRQEAFYIYDAVMHYGEAVRQLIKLGQDPYNGQNVVNTLRSTYRKSIQGFNVYINDRGESEGTYALMSVASDRSGKLLPWMWPVGNFNVSSYNGSANYSPGDKTIAWINGKPNHEPQCGFDGAKCENKDKPWEHPLMIAGLVLSLVLAVGAAFLIFRHVLYEQRLDRLSWKIEFSAIELLDAGQVRQMISPGRPRKKVQSRWKAFLGSTDMAMASEQERERKLRKESLLGAAGIKVGVYRGSHVAVRMVVRKHVEVNRALKKALMMRKEMNHENINRFIGACIDLPRVYIVSQFCSRHSLQDILKNEDSPLDDMFITSLVQDLYKGMTFIHDSEFGYHGNLKSSKCLVDSRWVLKINDFGVGALMARTCLSPVFRATSLLWRAPELLRTGIPPPQGSQKGDVYSFAIILYELYGRRGPWGDTKLSNSDIVRRLRTEDYTKQASVPPFRPDTSVLQVKAGVVPLIHECWHPDPDQRPDFKNTIRLKLKPLQQGLLKSNIIDNMLAMMEKHAQNLEVVVAERTEQLSMEKRMTENLLLRMLPRSVAELLKHGQPVAPEQYDQVSIYFSDIVGFTELSAQSTPMQIVDMLNDLYTCFDSIVENYDVYKVETIGDAYMVVSGLPLRNGMRHAGEIASMSLHVLAAVTTFRIRHRPDATLKIRIGIHTGPCCAGVVGLKMPRYCLFGDTVNTASRLETTGEALKIHCSQECRDILEVLGGYHLIQRGLIDMKGKGKKMTYFLLSEDTSQRMRRISEERLSPGGWREQRCVSASNMDYNGKIFFMENGTVRKLSGDHYSRHQHLELSNDSAGCNHVTRHSLSSIASSGASGTVTSPSNSQNGAGVFEELAEMQCLLDNTRTKTVPATRSSLSMFSRDGLETHL
ncbi:hypothetical protein C0Q70_02049 [Pomacea canaliculata]|uniref:Guanylate cyclase n=1 Tax=Pomacea canaliculata TaxID=400727 RepID=A0A2T7Q176_POMCA|nr:hypothetical protein C0Q70_02049 [Pomacea canaliculata]